MLKKLFIILVFLGIATLSYAGYRPNPFTGNQDEVPTISEIDGDPSVYAPYEIKVTNGTLTDNGDGTVTLTAGGGSVEGTAVLSTGEGGGTKYLREDGDGTSSWQTPAGSGDITSVGNVATGAAFDGTQGTILTFYNVGGNMTLTYNGTTLTASKYLTANVTGNLTGKADTAGVADTVTNATLTTALTVNTGTLTLTANAANNSVLTIGAGAVSVSGSNTGDNTVATSGDSATDFFSSGEIADAQISDTLTSSTCTGNAATVTNGVYTTDLIQLEKTIIDPDSVQAITDAVTIMCIEGEKYPNGITVVDFGIKTSTSSTYSVVLEEWSAPGTATGDLETVATSNSLEAEDDGTIGNGSGGGAGDCNTGSILKVDLPTTDVDELVVWWTFTRNAS